MKYLSIVMFLAAIIIVPLNVSAEVCLEGDCENGKGVLDVTGIGKYTGEFKDGARSGNGSMTYVDKCKYVGEWQNGYRHGKGTLTCPNKVYGDEWKDDRLVKTKKAESSATKKK